MLYDTFKKFGAIESAKVSLDKEHNCKGYGYVRFEDAKSAEYAIKEVTLFSFIFLKLDDTLLYGGAEKMNLGVFKYNPPPKGVKH